MDLIPAVHIENDTDDKVHDLTGYRRDAGSQHAHPDDHDQNDIQTDIDRPVHHGA